MTQPKKANSEVTEKMQFISRLLHHAMCMVGGFFAGYAILTRTDFLGNAQTANLIFLFFALVGRNPVEFFLRLLGFLIYFLGGFSYVYIKRKTKYNVKNIALILDFITILILGFIPVSDYVVPSLYPIFFAMSFQWNAFPGEYGYASSTIFSTNNTRQVSLSVAEYLIDHNKQQLHKAGFFACSLLFFHIGVIASYYFVGAFGFRGAWGGTVFICIATWIRFWEADVQKERKQARNFSKPFKTKIC